MENHVLYVWIFVGLLSDVRCIIQSDTFMFNSYASDKTCSTQDQLFTLVTNRKIACVGACLRWPGCEGVAYSPDSGLCTGCSKHYDIFSPMIEAPGSIFYAVVPDIGMYILIMFICLT